MQAHNQPVEYLRNGLAAESLQTGSDQALVGDTAPLCSSLLLRGRDRRSAAGKDGLKPRTIIAGRLCRLFPCPRDKLSTPILGPSWAVLQANAGGLEPVEVTESVSVRPPWSRPPPPLPAH